MGERHDDDTVCCLGSLKASWKWEFISGHTDCQLSCLLSAQKCQLVSGARLVLKEEDGVIHYRNKIVQFVPLVRLLTYSRFPSANTQCLVWIWWHALKFLSPNKTMQVITISQWHFPLISHCCFSCLLNFCAVFTLCCMCTCSRHISHCSWCRHLDI